MFVTLGDADKHVFDCEGPPDLCAEHCNHTNLSLDPRDSLVLCVVVDGFLRNGLKSRLHLVINFVHPLLNRAFWLNWYHERVFFAFV